jgi:hypothetical protein
LKGRLFSPSLPKKAQLMIPIKSKIKIMIDCMGIEKGIYIKQNPFPFISLTSNADPVPSFFLYECLVGSSSTDSFPELCI